MRLLINNYKIFYFFYKLMKLLIIKFLIFKLRVYEIINYKI